MMAMLLSAVLVVGMVSNAAPVTVFAQEDGETVETTQAEEPKEPAQEETTSEELDTDKPDGSEDTDLDEPEDSDPEDKEDSTPGKPEDKEDGTPEDPNGGAEQDPPEPDEETGEEITEPGTEEENESESVGDNDAPTESVSENNITGENNDFQALLARIAALPDAEEYLAGEPDADSGEVDEAAYEEWLTGLYAHAEEAFCHTGSDRGTVGGSAGGNTGRGACKVGGMGGACTDCRGKCEGDGSGEQYGDGACGNP